MNGMVRDFAMASRALAPGYPLARTRRWLFVCLVAAVSAVGMSLMITVLSGNGLQPLELVVLVLFGCTFLWIAQAFCSALIGAALVALRLDPLTLRRNPAVPDGIPRASRTAVVMPVHNEEVERVIAGLEATCLDVLHAGLAPCFDFFLLSDSTDDVIAARERLAVASLEERLRNVGMRIRYRRRRDNTGRKAGNIAEFCERWGHGYDHFVILDADSVMSARTLGRLARAMEQNPAAGLIQTVPLPVRQRTTFGRAVQFASSLYSPMLAAGQSFWQLDASNYWGHNAIIRLAPFRDHCRLPVLPGAPPLGGEILSHDFVEAALLRRAGWQVLVIPELGGSFEEVPGNILDFARRDRRWSEGNLQHLRLLGMPGLHALSRVHFLQGAFAYGCSFLWLLMLLASSADAIARAAVEPSYFSSAPALFPNWPVSHATDMWSLLGIVVTMLFLPKLLGLALGLADPDRRRAFGGAFRLIGSASLELVLSVLVAPVLMCFHARFVGAVLLGRRARWDAQDRDGRQVGLSEAWRATAAQTLIGVGWGALVYVTAPIFFWTLLPVLTGLILAGVLVAGTSHFGAGACLERWGLFRTPSESEPDPVLSVLDGLSKRDERRVGVPTKPANVVVIDRDAGRVPGLM